MKGSVSKISRFAVCAFCALAFSISIAAQSTDQNFPTPITSSEINGTIKARDMGDSRVTSYFYAFDGGQGDIFINVASRNFSGDIDIFTADTLQPLTKMVIYSDIDAGETGRLIYLRKGTRLILRIEGRTPNDDAATYRIKFAGSFIALAPEKKDLTPKIEKTNSTETGITVNSVGTIVQVQPKKRPVKKVEEITKAETPPEKKGEIPRDVPVKTEEDLAAAKTVDETKAEAAPVKPQDDSTPAKTGDDTKPETVFENKSAKVTVEPIDVLETNPDVKSPPKAPAKSRTRPNRPAGKPPITPLTEEEKAPDPLAAIRLVIEMKDGKVIWAPMNEVLKFSVDKGVLTVIRKDGNISRYSILDVAKVTIQ